MSVSNQHNLPRMLQRGFLAKGAKDKTWLFEAGKAPVLENIARIGAGENFYSKPDAQKPNGLTSVSRRQTSVPLTTRHGCSR
ncbi:MAG: hypothetical protein ACXU82_20065 [Caulobacteraceae bacterium]